MWRVVSLLIRAFARSARCDARRCAVMQVIVSGPALPVGVVSAAWKIVYVPVPKAACTSMLWTLADAQQETAEPLGIASSAAVTRSLLVHEPAFWRRTAFLHTLP